MKLDGILWILLFAWTIAISNQIKNIHSDIKIIREIVMEQQP